MPSCPLWPCPAWTRDSCWGYTCFATPQLWMRDHIIEVAGILPHGAAQAAKLDPAFAAAMEELTAALGKEE